MAMPALKENHIVSEGSEEEDAALPTRKKKCSKIRPPKREHIVTKHNYHDHLDDPVVMSSNGANNPSFPAKLHEMLQKVDDDGYAHVVSWQPHGRCFVVHDPSAFKTILPNYFKLSKLASFQRQLNLYGFQRLTAGLDKNGYYHELFLRGRTDLVAKMNRIKVKGTGVRAKANPDEEPNLYLYPAVDLTASAIISAKKLSASSPHASNITQPMSVPVPPAPSAVVSKDPSPLTVPSLPSVLMAPTSAQTAVELALQHSTLILDENDSSVLDRLIDAISTTTGGEAHAINFDRLIDVMFTHGQTVQFGDLVKLATI